MGGESQYLLDVLPILLSLVSFFLNSHSFLQVQTNGSAQI